MDEKAAFLQSILARSRGGREPDNPSYRVFTREFDAVCRAEELDSVLGRMAPASRTALDEAWATYTETFSAHQMRLGATALAAAERIKAAVPAEQREQIVLTLLVDLSGSMRGERILLALAAVDSAQDFLGGLGVKTEVLGFTTLAWHGGRSRKRWYLTGSEGNPGRLNDLLHIIFKSADDVRLGTGSWAMRQMLRPKLHKENIDGEALEWAVQRLRAIEASRRILIVVSDGAPVDDATLEYNSLGYLAKHLRTVIATTRSAGDVELLALGICYDVSRFYGASERVNAPTDIGEKLIGLIERALVGDEAA